MGKHHRVYVERVLNMIFKSQSDYSFITLNLPIIFIIILSLEHVKILLSVFLMCVLKFGETLKFKIILLQF